MARKEPKRGPGRPATGQIPKRYFRMEDGGWDTVQAAAKASGGNVSAYIRNTLLRAAKRGKK